MFKITRKANILFAIFVIISLVSTLSIVIYNNVNILKNNFVTSNSENDYLSIIYEKWDLIIDRVVDYNSNWNWYTDIVGCPQNITMSWTTMSWSSISTNLIYFNWKSYCSWIYNSSEFRIYFNETYANFSQGFYENDILEIIFNISQFEWIREFNDSDSTLMTFTSDWTTSDNIDDNFNSDNYRVDSQTWTYYPNSFQDDDVISRKTIVGMVWSWEINKNIFWNNYKTNNIIDSNENNNDNLNIKIWDTTEAIMYLDINNILNNNYDLTIFEFDKTKYTTSMELTPIKKIIWKNLINSYWYIQNNSWVLSISETLNWNEYIFDFQNKDYWIFISNYSWNMFYRLSSQKLDWTWIYITPVDDSQTWIIEVIANNIILDVENNFLWENIKIISNK